MSSTLSSLPQTPEEIEKDILAQKKIFDDEWKTVQKEYRDLLDSLQAKQARSNINDLWQNKNDPSKQNT